MTTFDVPKIKMLKFFAVNQKTGQILVWYDKKTNTMLLPYDKGSAEHLPKKTLNTDPLFDLFTSATTLQPYTVIPVFSEADSDKMRIEYYMGHIPQGQKPLTNLRCLTSDLLWIHPNLFAATCRARKAHKDEALEATIQKFSDWYAQQRSQRVWW